MLYIIHIKDKKERIEFASDIKKLLQNANVKAEEYIPSKNTHIYNSDIGIKSNNVNKKVLAQVLSQIERRGYTVINAKGSDNPSLLHSASSPQQTQKTTGEVTNGNIT